MDFGGIVRFSRLGMRAAKYRHLHSLARSLPMGVFSRLSDFINSNLNAMLDRAEDPQKIVRLIIQEMEDTLVETRTAAARSIADRKELSRRVAELDTAVADWQRKAELAVSRGRDDLAKAALAARGQASETV